MFEYKSQFVFFRYHSYEIVYDDIFPALTKCEILERIMIISEMVSDESFAFTFDKLQPFLSAGQNLVFVGFASCGIPKSVKKTVCDVLDAHEKLHPARYFRIINFLGPHSKPVGDPYPEMPNLHYNDILCNRFSSKICEIDPYQDFLDF